MNADPIAAPRVLARTAGVLYLIIIVLGIFSQAFVVEKLTSGVDAAATAANLTSQESLWRLGIAAHYFYLLCAVPLLLIFYVLFRPASRDIVLLAVFFNLISIAVEAVVTQYLVLALFPLGSAAYLGAFQPEQLHVLSRMAVRANGYGFTVSLIFFGAFCLTLGHVIYRCGFVPKVLGVLMGLAGLAYWTNGFALLLFPAVPAMLSYALLLPAFVGETSLCLWLLVKGVDEAKWWARARAQEQAYALAPTG